MTEMESLLRQVNGTYEHFVMCVMTFMDDEVRENAMLDYLKSGEEMNDSDVLAKMEEICEQYPNDKDDEDDA